MRTGALASAGALLLLSFRPGGGGEEGLMGALSKRWSVFWTAIGTRRYGLTDAAKVAAGLVAVAYLWWFGHEMSHLEIGLAVAVFVLIILVWIVLEHAVLLTDQISDARLRLAELRESGVALRNDAAEVKDVDAFEKWEPKVVEWTNEVQCELKKISESDAVWFSVLDVIPPPRIQPPIWPVGRSAPYGHRTHRTLLWR